MLIREVFIEIHKILKNPKIFVKFINSNFHISMLDYMGKKIII